MKLTLRRFPTLAVVAYLVLTTVLASLGNAWSFTVRPWIIWPWALLFDPTVDFIRERILFYLGSNTDSAIRWFILSGIKDTLYILVGSLWWYGIANLFQRIIRRLLRRGGIQNVDPSSDESRPRKLWRWKMFFVICGLTILADAVLFGLRYSSDKARFANYIEQIHRWNTNQTAGTKYPYLLEPGIPVEDYRQIVSSLPYSAILMERTECYGACPAYKLWLSRAGQARYEGGSHVKLIGVYTGAVHFTYFAHLCNAMERLNFKGMDDEYMADWTDVASTTITLFGDGTNVVKKVHEYGGVGPIELWTLQQSIDAVGTKIEWSKTEETGNTPSVRTR